MHPHYRIDYLEPIQIGKMGCNTKDENNNMVLSTEEVPELKEA